MVDEKIARQAVIDEIEKRKALLLSNQKELSTVPFIEKRSAAVIQLLCAAAGIGLGMRKSDWIFLILGLINLFFVVVCKPALTRQRLRALDSTVKALQELERFETFFSRT